MADRPQPPRHGATSETTVNAFLPRETPLNLGSGRTAPPPTGATDSDFLARAQRPATTFADFPYWGSFTLWLHAMSQNATPPVVPTVPEHHSAQTAATVCHHLGIGFLEAGVRLLLANQNNRQMEKIEWMLHPTLFPALWSISQYSLDVQPVLDQLDPRYAAWRLAAAANGELLGPHQAEEAGARTLSQLRYREEGAESCCGDSGTSGSGYPRKKRQRQEQQRAAFS
ncbi:hypothetical protein Ndes2526B_g08015 [Nannochloris sp. 'desiccata']|nr:hypothetical protein KSW81_002658 [Chlorella desiccata (nom. nud.)]